MKKILTIIFLQLCICSFLFGATINSKEGYLNLKWGFTTDEVKKAGYELKEIKDQDYIFKIYTELVQVYETTSKEKSVSLLQFHFYKGKLFAVVESVDIKNASQKNLEDRYGNFSNQGIIPVGSQYMDVKLNPEGNVSSLSIMITPTTNFVSTIFCDWNIYKTVSIVGKALNAVSQKSIVEELIPLANKLIQENPNGEKYSYAFMPLTTDYKNTLVDNYITDALSEAMFNTGKIKIIERSNLEALLTEQKFQASGLVNETTAKSIGMIVGANFVCYGTLKDLGNNFSVTARVVDVETGEIVAMSRIDVTKDDYLKNQPQKAVGTSVYTPITQTSSTTSTVTTSESEQITTNATNTAWEVVKYRDDFEGCTQYIFKVNSSDEKMLVISYKKCNNPANSRVIAGIFWTDEYNGIWQYSYNIGTYDIKGISTTITKKLENDWKVNLDVSNKEYFYIGWDEKSGSRWLVDIIRKSDSVAVRRDGLSRRFQTAGLLEKMAQYGITWAEIDAALANEEF